MAAILYLWICYSGYSHSCNWINQGSFSDMAKCRSAIHQLAVDPKYARCVDNR